jgi:hypothetical protein
MRQVLRPHVATLVMLGVVLFSALFVAGWFAHVGVIKQIIWQLRALQQQPPIWLQVPVATGGFLFFPTIALSIVALAITCISPQPKVWSRLAIVAILLILTLRYVIWRSLTTLNLTDPLNGSFSVGLFILEMFSILNGALQLFLLVQTRDRRSESGCKIPSGSFRGVLPLCRCLDSHLQRARIYFKKNSNWLSGDGLCQQENLSFG